MSVISNLAVMWCFEIKIWCLKFGGLFAVFNLPPTHNNPPLFMNSANAIFIFDLVYLVLLKFHNFHNMQQTLSFCVFHFGYWKIRKIPMFWWIVTFEGELCCENF